MLKKILITLTVLIIALVVLGIFLGLFQSVNIRKIQAGPYKIMCLDHIGSYKNICRKIKSVDELLSKNKIKPIAFCGVFYDDPRKIDEDKLRSKGGCIVKEFADIDILEQLTIPKTEVVSASIKAHPAIAPIKTYPKIEQWLSKNKYKVTGPSLEIYHNSGVVEVQMPIGPKTEKTDSK